MIAKLVIYTWRARGKRGVLEPKRGYTEEQKEEGKKE
jgi:hypothetical protein